MSSIHDESQRGPRRPSTKLAYGLLSPRGDGSGDRHTLPFVVGVLGDFTGRSVVPLTPLADRKFVQVDTENFYEVIRDLAPGLEFRVEDTLGRDGAGLAVRLEFRSLDDFEPYRIAQQVPPLARMLETREALHGLRVLADRSPLLEATLGRLLQDPREMERLKDELHAGPAEPRPEGILARIQDCIPPDIDPRRARAMLSAALGNPVAFDGSVAGTLDARTAALDAALSRQLAPIMHHPDFQRLEGTWRGLRYLLMNTEVSTRLKIKVLNVSKGELLTDLGPGTDFDRSETFNKIYTDGIDTPGGEPFGALVGDYEFTSHPDDVELLAKMSRIGAAAFCPFISAVSPWMFGFKDWNDLPKVRDLATALEARDVIKWRSFRDSEESRFVTLVMPRVLSRLPYGAATSPDIVFGFEEFDLDPSGTRGPVPHEHHAWMNAAYVLGAVLTRSFAMTMLCAAIRGVEGGGVVDNLPASTFMDDHGEPDSKCPTEVGITERIEFDLSTLGFLPLCNLYGTGRAVFFGMNSCHKPKKYGHRHDATECAAILARLPCLMVMSRFMHYLKVIAREKAGDFRSPEECQAWLNAWISDYVLTSPGESGPELRARYPLREAGVVVKAASANGGRPAYRAEVRLMPFLIFEELTQPQALVTMLHAGKPE